MKLLVDENLSPRLARELAELFPDSHHVSELGLSSTPDAVIWEFARERGFAFLTKDRDFANLSLVRGAPPKVVLLETGNCSARTIMDLVRKNAIRLAEFDRDAVRGILILR